MVIKKALLKAGKTKITIISLALITIFIVTLFAVFVLAAHTQNSLIEPEFVQPSSIAVDYMVTVTNDGGDNIKRVIIEIPTGYDENTLNCGPAPEDWAPTSDGASECIYRTNTDFITEGNSETFTLTIDTPSEEGTHTWLVTTIDTAPDSDFSQPTTQIDGTSPTVSSFQPADGGFVDTGAQTISASLGDDASGVDVSSVTIVVNGNDVTTEAIITSTSVSFTPQQALPDGSVSVTITASDVAGNSNSASFSFTVDTIDPVVSINPVTTPTNNPTQTITGTFTEVNIGTITVNGVTAIITGNTYSATITLSEGNNLIISVVATDKAGRTGSASTSILLDTILPIVTVLGAPPLNPTEWSVDDNGFSANVNCDDTGGSGCNTVLIHVSPSEIIDCSSIATSLYSTPPSAIITSHLWVCGFATDNAGNSKFSSPEEFRVSSTIQGAIDVASPGDTIHVSPGIYNENVVIDKSLITLNGDVGDLNVVGPGPNAPVLDGENVAGDGIKILPSVSDVTIEGFIIRNYASSGNGIGNAIQAWVNPPTTDAISNVIVRHNRMENLGWNGVLVGSEGQSIHTGWVLEHNVISNSAFVGLELTNVQNSFIRNNDVTTAGVAGILLQARNTISGSGMVIVDGNKISDNSVGGGTSSIYLLGLASEPVKPFDPITGAQAELTNTIVSGNTVTGGIETLRGIRILGFETGSIDTITVSGNTVTEADIGILVDGDVTGTAINNNNILDNDIGLDAVDGIKPAIEEVNAEKNWWGSADGPQSGEGSGTGDTVSLNVDFEPWLFTPHPDTIDPEIVSMNLVGSFSGTNIFSPIATQIINIELTASEFVDYKSVRIINSEGVQVRSISIGGPTVFEISRVVPWNGKDQGGNIVTDGEYTVKVNMEDLSGNLNLDDVSDLGTILVDNIPPTTSDNSVIGIQVPTHTVTITPSDALSGVSNTFFCVDSGGTCNPLVGGTDQPFDVIFDATKRGVNHLRYFSIDIAGNQQGIVDKIININQLPIASGLTLTQTDPTTIGNLIGDFTYSDADGDLEGGTEIRWFKNTILQLAFNDLLTLPSSATSKGEQWHFTVKPDDGREFGALQTSDTVTIQNTQPTAPVIDLIPNQPLTTDDLVTTIVTESTDVDGDTVTLSFEWSKGGVLQGDLITDTVLSTLTAKGEVWSIVVTPNDGTENGPSATDEVVTILNSAPALSPISPQEATAGQLFELQVGATDPDGDTLTFSLVTPPTGMTINSTGFINWTPTNAQALADSFEVEVKVTDDDSGVATQIFTIDVFSYKIQLFSGLNFISIPLVPSDTEVEAVLFGILPNLDSVWAYDPVDRSWDFFKQDVHDGVGKIVPGRGYYVKMNDVDTLRGDGEKVFRTGNFSGPPPSVTLADGWNAIGHYGILEISKDDALKSLVTDFTTYGAVLDGEGNLVNTLSPTEGLWIFVKCFRTDSERCFIDYAPSEASYNF